MSIALFHIIDDGVAILRVRGKRYQQVKVYQRGGDVFAGMGSSYVRLMSGGNTSDPGVTWQDIEAEGVVFGLNRLPKFPASATVKAA